MAVKKSIKKEEVSGETSIKKISQKKDEVKETAVATLDKAIEPIKENNKFSMSKTWLEEKQLIRILQRTPTEHIYQRKGKGGGMWDYVTGAYVEKVLNYVFGWNWDFEVVSQEIIGLAEGYGQIVVLGKLTVKDDKGHTISKSQYGRKEVAYKKEKPTIPLDLGNDYKAAATDSLKKCASLLGIASDIYGKEEFKDILGVKRAKFAQPKVKPMIAEAEEVEMPPFNPDLACESCNNPLNKDEAEFSLKIHKRKLCRTCQKAGR